MAVHLFSEILEILIYPLPDHQSILFVPPLLPSLIFLIGLGCPIDSSQLVQILLHLQDLPLDFPNLLLIILRVLAYFLNLPLQNISNLCVRTAECL